MSEIWLRVGDREFEGRKDNMELFIYLGELAVYNHVDLKGVVKHKIFQHENPYDQVAQYMFDNDYPIALNQVHVDEPVRWHFEKHLEQEFLDIDRYYELLGIDEDGDEHPEV